MTISSNLSYRKGPTFQRVAPFAVFMAFIAIQEGVQYLESYGMFGFTTTWLLLIYPLKTIAVGGLLFAFRKSYSEIVLSDLTRVYQTISAILIGVAVFSLWITMDWPWATIGTPKGFNPMVMSESFTRYLLISFRLLGATIIVPIMEELFWRSWLLRYLISPTFQSVKLGEFSIPSFLIATIMFGVEHNLWLAGIMAGTSYTLLLYRSKSIMQCIVAHGVTNFILGMYVIQTGNWQYW